MTNSSDPLVPPPGVLSSLRQAKCSFHIASPSHYSRPSERFDRFSGCNFRTEVVETGEKSTDFVTSGVAQTNQGLDSEHCDDSQAENSAVAELLIVGLEELLSCKIMSKVATRSFPVEVNIANSMRTLRKTSEQQVTSQENPSVWNQTILKHKQNRWTLFFLEEKNDFASYSMGKLGKGFEKVWI